MFFIFGISPLKKPGTGILRHHCPHCNDIRNFQENNVRNYISIFFIPLVPISKPSSFYSCPTCGYMAIPGFINESSKNSSPESEAGNQVIIFCKRCEGPMYIPLNEQRQKVTCPHCTMEFVVKGIKGIIPTASVELNMQ